MAVDQKQHPKKHTPYRTFSIIGLLLVAGTAGGLYYYTEIEPIWIYFIALSVSAFLLVAYDKMVAGGTRGRVPEMVLWGVALLGGTPGLLLAMNFFRHKTRKLSFQIVFVLILLAQAAGAYWLLTQQGDSASEPPPAAGEGRQET